MRFFDIIHHTTEDIAGIRFQFLWIFSFTITHHEKKGSHLNLGFGLMPFEISTQFSIWNFNE